MGTRLAEQTEVRPKPLTDEWEFGERFVIVDHSMHQNELPIKVIGVKEEESETFE